MARLCGLGWGRVTNMLWQLQYVGGVAHTAGHQDMSSAVGWVGGVDGIL